MNFDKIYEENFPTELKPCFEEYLMSITGWQFMASGAKLQFANAFISGYTAAVKHRVLLRRMMIDRVYDQIDQAIETGDRIEPKLMEAAK